MTLLEIRDMLFWCSAINVGLLIFFAILFLVAGKLICRIHAKLWGLTEQEVRTQLYRVMSVYKVLVFVFNVIPWIALGIIS
jgi:hypothetical protein